MPAKEKGGWGGCGAPSREGGEEEEELEVAWGVRGGEVRNKAVRRKRRCSSHTAGRGNPQVRGEWRGAIYRATLAVCLCLCLIMSLCEQADEYASQAAAAAAEEFLCV